MNLGAEMKQSYSPSPARRGEEIKRGALKKPSNKAADKNFNMTDQPQFNT